MRAPLLAAALLVVASCVPVTDRSNDDPYVPGRGGAGGSGGGGGSGGSGGIGTGGTGGAGEGGSGGIGTGGTGGAGEGGSGGIGTGGTGGAGEGGSGGIGTGGTGGGEGGSGGTGTGGTGGTGGSAGQGGSGGTGGGPELPPNPRAAGWTAVWCQRLAQGYETAGYPATGPNPDPHAYLYAAANTQTGTTLRNTLHGLLANHAILSYTEARQEMFGNLDDRGGDVTCVYTGRVVHAGGAIPDSTVMNTEHSWAQSWFTTADASQGAKSDLHHLFPTDSHANSVRGNYPFGHPASSITEVYDPTHPGVLTGSRLGTDAGGRRVFEPRNEHKGNLARALFYFAVRYAEPIEPWQEDVLRCWNALDPPDAAEVARTNGVELLEGTRNPFVDHPEYVERIADF